MKTCRGWDRTLALCVHEAPFLVNHHCLIFIIKADRRLQFIIIIYRGGVLQDCPDWLHQPGHARKRRRQEANPPHQRQGAPEGD